MIFVYLSLAVYSLGIGSTLLAQHLIAWHWERRARRRGNARVTNVALLRLQHDRKPPLPGKRTSASERQRLEVVR